MCERAAGCRPALGGCSRRGAEPRAPSAVCVSAGMSPGSPSEAAPRLLYRSTRLLHAAFLQLHQQQQREDVFCDVVLRAEGEQVPECQGLGVPGGRGKGWVQPHPRCGGWKERGVPLSPQGILGEDQGGQHPRGA